MNSNDLTMPRTLPANASQEQLGGLQALVEAERRRSIEYALSQVDLSATEPPFAKKLTLSAEVGASREDGALRELLQLVNDDSHALCFQSFDQYRKVLAGEIGRKLRGLAGADDVRVIAIDPAEPGGDKTVMSAMVLVCPFCGGPGCPFVGNANHPYGAAPKQDDYGDDGLLVQAHVFCHSCGSEGPMFEGTLYGRDDYLRAKQVAITYWNKRGIHPELEVRQWEAL